MDKNPLHLTLYEISMSIGNTFDLKSMLNESITRILSRLNCSSASISKKNNEKFELLYSKPKVLVKDKKYISIMQDLEIDFDISKERILVQKVDDKYYYLFELKNFGYFALTKSGKPLDDMLVKSLTNINLKLVNAIKACLEHSELQEYKARLSEAQSIAHLGSWTTSFPSRRHHWDDEIFRILGEEPQSFEPSYRYLLKRLTAKSKKEFSHAVNQVFQGKIKEYKGLIEIVKKDGSIALVEVQSRIVFDTKGMPLSLVGTTLDISKQHALEQKLRDESSLLKTIINTVPLRIFWKDKESNYMGANKLFTQDASLENPDELIGKNDFDMPWKETDEAELYREDDKNVMDSGVAKLNFEEPQTHVDGSVIWISTSKVPLKNEAGEIFGVLGTYHDITSIKENEKNLKLHRDALQYQANHDALTDLPNRTLFLDRLQRSLYKAKRNKSKVAVLFIDMDRFKAINDSLGHAFGDETIKEVAHRLELHVRKSDTVARFGGDEFVMILDDISDPMAVLDIVRKLMESMRDPVLIDDHIIYVTLSIGISIYPDDTLSADDLLKNADAAMYKAKDKGRDTCSFYTEDMTVKALQRMKIESYLREAIKNEECMLYFQPQVDVKKDKIIGMEALLRWEHETIGFVNPNIFIPIAEETGLIIPLGKWILKQGMHQMAKWYEAGLNPGVLAINLSMIQLQENDFVSILEEILVETGCKAKWLELEVTESQVMKDPEKTILMLNEISNLGIQIAIDDFGTGYSSLSYLKRLPIDILKIDRSFIQDLPFNDDDVVITKAIMALAKSLNLHVVAEGVETLEQKTFLLNNKCQYIQGYFYAKPMPADEMEKMLIGPLPNPPFMHTYDI